MNGKMVLAATKHAQNRISSALFPFTEWGKQAHLRHISWKIDHVLQKVSQ
jgi:hypothetical protein